MTDVSQPATPPPPRRNWSRFFSIAALILVSAIAGAAISRAAHYWHGPWHGFRHGHGPGMMMGGPVDPAEAERRVTWMTGYVAREVNATGEQRQKLETIAREAVKDLLPLRENLQAGRKQARELFVQPAVDRTAIETLRSEQLANLDAMSKRLSTAIADAAEVLTPEQRKELADRFPAGRGWRRHGWRM